MVVPEVKHDKRGEHHKYGHLAGQRGRVCEEIEPISPGVGNFGDILDFELTARDNVLDLCGHDDTIQKIVNLVDKRNSHCCLHNG